MITKTPLRIVLGLFLTGWLFPKSLRAADAMHATATVSALKYEFDPNAPDKLKERDAYLARYKVVITNKGTKSLRIPTADFIKGGEAGPNYTRTTLVWDLDTNDDGVTTVVPEADLKPVLLRPNEAVTIRWQELVYELSRLDQVQITLRITETFGKRYDVWAGEIVVSDIQVYREKKQ
ncbi:hypothetical protein K0B96_10480 [Horticoccus luteus]|uniref:Uncharacterized protein n=1 Tax=Horticoccus luteus TaxID=2862869 RepID=A0A8F9TTH1_9BACT|nr:hypothetical protein [Horticoccus luteus]QYM77751.1 hypothetical protein K0B96_10480 [Horticoccus luteus]